MHGFLNVKFKKTVSKSLGADTNPSVEGQT